MLIVEPKMVSIFWAHSPIYSIYMSFWCLFLDSHHTIHSHLTTYHSIYRCPDYCYVQFRHTSTLLQVYYTSNYYSQLPKQTMDFLPELHYRPLYTMAKGHNHEMLRVLETHPQAINWNWIFRVITGLQV